MKKYKDKRWLFEEYVNQKKELSQIAQEYNFKETTMRYWLDKFKIRRKKQYSDMIWLCQKYINEQQSALSVSKICNCDIKTVSYWLDKFNIPHHPIGQGRLGKKHTLKGRKNISKGRKNKMKGSDHPNWKGGITSLSKTIRACRESVELRNRCFQRDNYICQTCNKRGIHLNAHHIKPFIKILKENKITTLQEALECMEFWNLDNLRTLCVKCHKQTKTWGRGALN